MKLEQITEALVSMPDKEDNKVAFVISLTPTTFVSKQITPNDRWNNRLKTTTHKRNALAFSTKEDAGRVLNKLLDNAKRYLKLPTLNELGKEETEREIRKLQRAKIIETTRLTEALVSMPDKYEPQEGERVTVFGNRGIVVNSNPAPSGQYVTVKVGGKEKIFHKSDVMINKSKLSESVKTQARWVADKGPNDIGGFELQKKTNNGWATVGFTTKKPTKNAGVIELYHGASGKDVKVNLNDFVF